MILLQVIVTSDICRIKHSRIHTTPSLIPTSQNGRSVERERNLMKQAMFNSPRIVECHIVRTLKDYTPEMRSRTTSLEAPLMPSCPGWEWWTSGARTLRDLHNQAEREVRRWRVHTREGRGLFRELNSRHLQITAQYLVWLLRVEVGLVTQQTPA